MKLWDIYMNTFYDSVNKGYSVFVEGEDEYDAVRNMILKHLYREAEDLGNIQTVTEVEKEGN